MELRLKGLGTIEITDATLLAGGDVEVKHNDSLGEIVSATEYKILNTYIVMVDYTWGLAIKLDIPTEAWDEEEYIYLEIENQDAIYRLKTLL